MSYSPTPFVHRPNAPLCAEEEELAEALWEYQLDPDRPEVHIGIWKLWDIYVRWCGENYIDPPISQPAFGFALGRVFPRQNGPWADREKQHHRRTYRGKVCRVRIGLVGPESETSYRVLYQVRAEGGDHE